MHLANRFRKQPAAIQKNDSIPCSLPRLKCHSQTRCWFCQELQKNDHVSNNHGDVVTKGTYSFSPCLDRAVEKLLSAEGRGGRCLRLQTPDRAHRAASLWSGAPGRLGQTLSVPGISTRSCGERGGHSAAGTGVTSLSLLASSKGLAAVLS